MFLVVYYLIATPLFGLLLYKFVSSERSFERDRSYNNHPAVRFQRGSLEKKEK